MVGLQEMRLKKQVRLGRQDVRAWVSLMTVLGVGSSDGI